MTPKKRMTNPMPLASVDELLTYRIIYVSSLDRVGRITEVPYYQGGTPAPHLNDLSWIIYVFNELIMDIFST